MVKMETDVDPSEGPSVRVVLPGDSVKQVSADAAIKLGPGVMQLPIQSRTTNDDSSMKEDASNSKLVSISASRAGILGVQKATAGKKGAKNASEMCWVEARSKRVGG